MLFQIRTDSMRFNSNDTPQIGGLIILQHLRNDLQQVFTISAVLQHSPLVVEPEPQPF